MAAADTRLVPTISLEQSNHVPYLHGLDASPLHSALHNDQAQPRRASGVGWSARLAVGRVIHIMISIGVSQSIRVVESPSCCLNDIVGKKTWIFSYQCLETMVKLTAITEDSELLLEINANRER